MHWHHVMLGVSALASAASAQAQVTVQPVGHAMVLDPAASQHDVPAAVRADDSQDPRDVIVTVERRAVPAQKTPLTIEVLSSDGLTRQGVTAPQYLASILPGVQIGTAGPATSVYIRGVGGSQAFQISSPAVPYYVDGIYIARSQSIVSEMYDLDRVELLKGPQATLYGRNAAGGAINILTRNPILGVSEVRGTLEIGDYGNQNGELAVNLPLGKTAALRLSGTVVDKDGYTSRNFGGQRDYAGRAKLLWAPGDGLSLLLNGSYGKIYGGAPAVVTRNRDIPGWYPWLDADDPRSQAYVGAIINGFTAFAAPGFTRAPRSPENRQNSRFFNISAQLDADLGFAKLTIIPAYRDAEMSYSHGQTFIIDQGAAIGDIPARPNRSMATSIEARLSGDVGPLTYVAGVYYDNETLHERFRINADYLQTPAHVDDIGTRSYAAFAQATLKVTDKVRLIGGLRYTADRHELTGVTYLISPVAFFLVPIPPQAAACTFPAPSQPKCVVDQFAAKKTFHNVAFKAGAEADVLDDSLLYATVSRGFKSGGFNTQSQLGTPGQPSVLEPEQLTAYEIGLKNQFLDNTLQINVSGFYWDYANIQSPVITYTNVPGIINLVSGNTAASEVYGGTLDVVARPWPGGTLSGSVEYAHSRYTRYDVTVPVILNDPNIIGCPFASANASAGTVTLDCSGFEVSRTPKWSGAVGVNQQLALGRGKLIGDATLTLASSRYIGTDFVKLSRVKGYGLLNLSLTYQAPVGHWSLTGFVRNATNATIYTDGTLSEFAPFFYADIQPPRTYGARLAFAF